MSVLFVSDLFVIFFLISWRRPQMAAGRICGRLVRNLSERSKFIAALKSFGAPG
jgi:hypothetical protein